MEWFARKASNDELRAQSLSLVVKQLIAQIIELATALDDAYAAVPHLESDLENLKTSEQSLREQILRTRDHLYAVAKNDIKKQHEVPAWERVLKFAAAAAPYIPIGQPYLAAAG
mgnify:CR=1 FL=1